MCDDKVGSIEEVINVGFVLIRNRMFECWISISVFKNVFKNGLYFYFFWICFKYKKEIYVFKMCYMILVIFIICYILVGNFYYFFVWCSFSDFGFVINGFFVKSKFIWFNKLFRYGGMGW